MQVLTRTIPNKLPILIKGAPGIGKSDIVAQACKAVKADLIIKHPVVEDPTDPKGMPWVHSTKGKPKATFIPFDDMEQLMTAKKLTVCFLDDLGQSAPAVQAAYMQLLLARRINGHKISDHVCFIAATNRRIDRAGVAGLLEPVKSRFASIIELEPDVDEWVAWALNNGLPTTTISFIRFRPELLFKFDPTKDLVNSPSPRTVSNVAKLTAMNLPGGSEYEMYAGAAGEGFAAEYLGFLKIYRSLPNPDAILMNPEKADVPDDPATLYALCGALANKASEQTVERLIKYSNRLPGEFNVLLMRDAVNLHPEIVNSRAFIQWSSDNADIVL